MAHSFKIIFAGTPAFAAVALKALLNSSHEIIAVYTQPDRPAGRGQKLTPSPVKVLALQHQIPLYQPISLRNEQEQVVLKNLNADLMVVAAYGLILPKAVLQAPRLGCVNIHASLLPRFRGAAPIHRAILSGEDETGITIMRMDEGLDTGSMLYKLKCPIKPDDTSASLHDQLAELGAKALLDCLGDLPSYLAAAEEQDDAQATYAQKITKEEAKINWKSPAEVIERQVRAFNPWPVAFTMLEGQPLRIWQAQAINAGSNQAAPGTIIESTTEGIDVATGKGILRLLQIQLPGGRSLSVAEILNAKKDLFIKGTIFT